MRKKGKRTEESSPAAEGGGGPDRLTDLPDPLRLQILTFLPLKSAIRTGTLSSRWRGLWRQRWPHPSSLDLSAPTRAADAKDFVEHVDRVLRLRGPRLRLDTLQITFHPGAGHIPKIKSWLDYAAECGVEVLRLDLSPPPVADVSRRPGRRGRDRHRAAPPPSFYLSFDGPALAHLTLCGFHLSCHPSHFKKFNSLEVLNLHGIHVSDTILRKMVAALPLLRMLDLRRCPDLRRVLVPGPRIASLTVVSCPKASELTVSSPHLRSFHFSSGFLSSYTIRNASALEDVYMSCGGPGAGLPRSNWLTAFGELSHVKVLTLCSLSLQCIAISGAHTIGELRNFQNLKELQLLMVMMADSNLMDIYSFFRLCRCPRLEKLFIELPTYMRDPSMVTFLDVVEEVPPESCFEYLKTVKINSFKGHNNEMQLARFLLSNAARLESLVIVAPEEHMREEYSKNAVDGYSDMLQFLHMQLSFIKKASANVQIVLVEHDDNGSRPMHAEAYCKV